MSLYDKVQRSPNICGIEIAFSGTVVPSSIPGYQPFFNSIPVGPNFSKLYHGKSTVAFTEKSVESASGTSYAQQLSFRFPSTDANRSTRIAALFNTRWVKISLTNRSFFLMGRNDYFQNKKPVVKVESNHATTLVTIETETIFPIGFIPDPGQFELPAFIPVSLTPLQ